MHGLALCAGVGGLELGLELALGNGYRCVGYVERDAHAAATLVARMEDSSLDSAPVWDDLATFPSSLYRGKVDLVSAGFPCQPFSKAGSLRGVSDDRWLWPHVERIVRTVAPGVVFLENVDGLVQRGLRHVLRSLAELGFDAEWGVFSAAGSGAPHIRRRFFLVAQRLADPGRIGLEGLVAPRAEERAACGGRGTEVGNADGGGREGERLAECTRELRAPGDEPVGSGDHRGVGWPPGPQNESGWLRWIAAGGPEPAILRGPDGTAHRVDRLRAIGNGVVPAVAARAFAELSRRLTT